MKKLYCLYCEMSFQAGGISRFKYHLAVVKGGEVEACKKVSTNVHYQMQQSIDAYVESS